MNDITTLFCRESNQYTSSKDRIVELVAKYGMPEDIIMDAIHCLPNYYYGDDMARSQPITFTVKTLLKLGGNAKYMDEDGCDCLWEACLLWNAEIVHLLLEAGADPDYVWEHESTLSYYGSCLYMDDIPSELLPAAQKTVELLEQYSQKHKEYKQKKIQAESIVESEPTIIERYIAAWNNLDINIVADYFNEHIVYHSQWVFESLSGKENVVKYFAGKFTAIKTSNMPVKMYLATYNGVPCAVMFQLLDKPEIKGSKRLPYSSATVLFDLKNNKINEINLCAIPAFEDLELM